MDLLIRFLSLLFIFCIPLCADGQSIEDEPIDSIILWLSNNYSQDSNDFQGIAFRTITKAQAVNSTKQLADLHTQLASWYGYHGFFHGDSTIFHDRKALDYYIQANDSSNVAATYQVMSIDLMNDAHYEEAQEAIFEAITLYEALDDEGGLANAKRSITNLFFFVEEYEDAIRYGLEALEYYEKVEDYDRQSYTLLTLTNCYQRLGRYEEAHEAARRTIELVDTKIPHQVFVLGRAYSYKADVSLAENKLDQALQEATQAWEIVSGEVGPQRASSYGDGIANVLRLQKKYREALTWYLSSVEQNDKQGLDDVYTLYENIVECYQALGDYENALVFQKREMSSRDKMNAKKIANLESEAVVKYETGKKDEALAAQERELKSKNRIQQLGIGLVAVLIAFLLSLVYFLSKNKKITAALRIKNSENEILLKEIHHRVKNNLQILSSLLNLQSNYIQDEQALDALKEGRNRVESMGLIHQKLYTQDNLTAVSMKAYLKELCEYLSDSFSSEQQRVEIKEDVRVDLVDVETAIPLGLIVNELITNSMKYAFGSGRSGTIQVNLWLNDDAQMCLEVSDDGQGLVESGEKKSSTNFGSDLIKILCKKLKGIIEQNTTEGYTTLIRFNRFKLV